jgi:hypothetical protein
MPYVPVLNWKNPSFMLYKQMMKKILIEHAHGASFICIATDENLEGKVFKEYIEPMAKVLKVECMKFKRPSRPYTRRLAAPV